MAVFVFTMQNGITIVADIISETDSAFIAKSPMALTPNDYIKYNIIAHKIFPFTNTDLVEINKDKVMFLGSPEPDLISYYLEILDFYNNSGIKLTYGMKGVESELKKKIESIDKSNKILEDSFLLPSNTTIH